MSISCSLGILKKKKIPNNLYLPFLTGATWRKTFQEEEKAFFCPLQTLCMSAK